MVAVKVTDCPACAGLGAVVSVVVVEVGAVIVSVNMLEVEVAKPLSPEYTAVRWSAPAGRLVVASVATPDEFRLPLPRRVSPKKKLTDPSEDSSSGTRGRARPGATGTGVTVAVRAIDWPTVAGFGVAVSAVVVLVTLVIVSVYRLDVEAAKLTLPE